VEGLSCSFDSASRRWLQVRLFQAFLISFTFGANDTMHIMAAFHFGQSGSMIDDDELVARTIGCVLDDWKLLCQEIQDHARPIFENRDGRLLSHYRGR
jgi:hypothetical protein